MTWYQAYDYCKSLDAYLAEILNNETQILLETYAADLPPTNWWIGATDQQSVSLHYLFLNMIPRYLSTYQANIVNTILACYLCRWVNSVSILSGCLIFNWTCQEGVWIWKRTGELLEFTAWSFKSA